MNIDDNLQGDFTKMTFFWAENVKKGIWGHFWSKQVILRHFWVKKRHFRSFLAISVTFLQNHPVRVEVTHGHRLFPAAVIDARKDLITVQYEDGTNQSISAAEQGKIRKSHHCNNNLAITPEIVQSLVPQHTQLEIKSTSTISTGNTVSQPLECWERMKFVAKAGENLLILSCFSEPSNTQVVDLSAAGDSIRMPNSSQTAAAGGDWSSEHCCVHFEHMKIEDKQVQELCKSTPSVNDEFCKRIGAQKIYRVIFS